MGPESPRELEPSGSQGLSQAKNIRSSWRYRTQAVAFHHTLLGIRVCNPSVVVLTWASASEMFFCS